MHNFNVKKKTIELAGKQLTIETGRMAKQANGSVFVTYGETCVLVTATADKEPKEGTDFFPLTVDFIEKMYASGKIPGGFFKREAKPSTRATLNARLIDRPIRPLFPKGFRNSVHIVVTVLSYDGENDPGMLGILGASAALSISDIPFHGPIASAKVGLINDEIVINPTKTELDSSRLDLDVAATESSVVMIESGANEVSEDKMIEAVYTGHQTIKKLISLQQELIDELAPEKMDVELKITPEEIIEEVENSYGEKIKKAVYVDGKQERDEAIGEIKEQLKTDLEAKLDKEEFEEKIDLYKNAFKEILTKFIRDAILKDHHRADGRGLDDIRPITCEIDVLPRVHGSALFTRGETQSLGTVTLGSGRDEKIIDGLDEEFKKPYFLHYNFPPFSVGEAGWMRGPGRRELGHGALAERALYPMMPDDMAFPYTIRVVSDILESNGSSSMATVCSGTLALMAAGVPLKKPVAGIANGLIMEDGEFVVLTDIMGLEDHLGDMDFKVTGTKDGITALQMDIKIEGITREIMEQALAKARKARMFILDKITETIAEPRKEPSSNAPRIQTLKVKPSKIGEIIGSGGKMINSIIDSTGAQIEIDDDGKVTIFAPNKESVQKAHQFINDIVSDPKMYEIYEGVVTRIENYGAFVKFMHGAKEGLVHISQLHNSHVKNVKDMLKLGDKVNVKFTGFDRGKIKLTMKGVEGNPTPKPSHGSDRDYKRDNRRDHHKKRR